MKGFSVKSVVAVGIGAAIFVVLTKISIPSPIANTTIQVTYGFLTLMSFIFGPIVGFLIGLIGHALGDMINWGSIWWSWVFASAAFGLLAGILGKMVGINSFSKRIVFFIIGAVVVNVIVWGGIAPGLDVLIYAEPMDKVFAQGLMAGLINAVSTIVLGGALIFAYSKTMVKEGSLSKD
jgi:Predicted membrane protein